MLPLPADVLKRPTSLKPTTAAAEDSYYRAHLPARRYRPLPSAMLEVAAAGLIAFSVSLLPF